MTTLAPASIFISLADRLAAAELVAIVRARETVEEWSDPCGDATQRFTVVEAVVDRVLRGEAADVIRIRALVDPGDKVDSPATRLSSGNPVLVILAMDEVGDTPLFGLQHGSAYVVDGEKVDVPAGLAVGAPDELEGGVEIGTFERLLEDLAAVDHERRMRYAEVDPDWERRDYPEVTELPDRQARAERAVEAGPVESRPAGELRPRAKRRPSTRKGPSK